MTRARVGWYRWAILGVIAALGVLAYLSLRGPIAWQRAYYPLKYREQIADSAARHEVNPYLVAAVVDTESSWDPEAKSSAGAIGLMQLLPASAADLAQWGIVDDEEYPADRLSDPAVNIEYGTAYLRYLVERYHEIEPALAAYNGGLSNADKWVDAGDDVRETIEFPETRVFVLKVVRARELYERLYPDAFERAE